MLHQKLPLADTRAFSSFFLDYIRQNESLRPFYHRYPTLSNFKDQIDEKSKVFPQTHRDVLVATLKKQYDGIAISDAVAFNLDSLSDSKTFTVTTGHQLNIFTGPLYFIYKIVTVINACRQLKERHPDYNFVPVYWMASEDHDYEEIKYFRLYGKKYIWETSQQGAVGRFKTLGFDKLLSEIPGDIAVFRNAYLKNETLAEAVRDYVNALFGESGLIVVDADDADLKTLFAPVIEDDLFNNTTVNLVNRTDEELASLGYKTQVYCRDINFFYLDDNTRARIEKQGDRYVIVDSDISFSAEQIRELLRQSPEKFSPNVILRPLYQEYILPNLAYVGGPAENIYWLQLKKVFEHHGTPFPMLMPRNFALVIDHPIHQKLKKTGLELGVFFENKNTLFNQWTLQHAKTNLTLSAERNAIREIYDQLKERAESIDVTLGPFASAEAKRAMNSLEKMEQKFLRAEKRRHRDKLRQIEAVKDALFPNGSLQERTDNLLNFYQQDDQFITRLIQHLDPFDYEFNILIYDRA